LGRRPSSLIFAILKFDPWCNGNTTDFGSVIYGSNPYGSTIKTKTPLTGGVFYLLATKAIVFPIFHFFLPLKKSVIKWVTREKDKYVQDEKHAGNPDLLKL
jgi:hypothetical protein